MQRPRSTSYLILKTGLTFVCFLATLFVLFYLGMGDKARTLTENFFAISEDNPRPVFYQSIGAGITGNDADEGERVARVYTLELAVLASRQGADRMIADLTKSNVRAFYSEVRKDKKVVYSVRKGIYPSVAEAEDASVSLRDQNFPNKIIELD